MGSLQPWHWAVIAIVFLALFGYKKLPDATRSVGRSLRIFKSEMKGLHDDLREDDEEEPSERPRTTPASVIEAQPLTDARSTTASRTSDEAPRAAASTAKSGAPAESSAAKPPANGS